MGGTAQTGGFLWNAFDTEGVKLMDVTINALNPNTNMLQTPQTGSLTAPAGTSISVTTNSIANSNVSSGYAEDATILDITPPIASNGTFPDFTFTVSNGTTNLQQLLQVDGSMGACMFPRAKLTLFGRRIMIGKSTRTLLRSGSKDVLSMTGLKVTNAAGLSLYVSSTAGWTNPMVPARVEFRGEQLTQAEVEELMPKLTTTTFTITSSANGSYSGVYETDQSNWQAWWNSLPGGVPGGKKAQINRKIVYAYNAIQVAPAATFPFSQQNVFGATSANLASQNNDLGDDFRNGGQAFEWLDIGFNLYPAGSAGYLAFRLNSTIVPAETQNGVFVTQGSNPFAYGARGSTGRFQGLTPVKYLAQVFSNNVALVPVFTPVGAAIPVGGMSFVKAGIAVVGGQVASASKAA